MPASELRNLLLATIAEQTPRGPTDGNLQSSSVLRAVARAAGLRGDEQEQLLLTVFGDLFRSGHLAWGINLANTNPPFFHVTDTGRAALGNFSRDPVNPDGYMAYVNAQITLNPIAASYLNEALSTYNANNFKASAVMVGASAESIALEVRDSLLSKLNNIGLPAPAELTDWRISVVLRGINDVINPRSRTLGQGLRESFTSYWPAFTQQIRKVRNDSGHPSSIEPVTVEDVHAALLTFPMLASMAQELRQWIEREMTA